MLINLYGPSSAGKTSLIGTLARHVHQKWGLKTRLYSGDGGGWTTIDHLVSKGIVEPWDVAARPFEFETLGFAARGYWPADVNNPESPLLEPWLYSWVLSCVRCKTQRTQDSPPVLPKSPAQQGIMCPKCKTQPLAVRKTRKANPRNDLSKYGLVAHEGLTAYGEMLLDNMTRQSAQGIQIGEKASARFMDGSEPVGTTSRTSYGIAQRRVKSLVNTSRWLLGTGGIRYVVWSARKARGTDEEKRAPVFGPKVVGSAITDEVPSWFGPTFAVSLWPDKDKVERRVYLTSFYEVLNPITKDIENLANSRIPVEVLDGVPTYVPYKPGDALLLGKLVTLIENKQKEASDLKEIRQ